MLSRGNAKLLVLSRGNPKYLVLLRNNTKHLVLERSNNKQIKLLLNDDKFRCYRVITLNYYFHRVTNLKILGCGFYLGGAQAPVGESSPC